MNKIALITFLLFGSAAAEYAIAEEYSGASCSGNITKIVVWDTRCSNDEGGADSSSYYTCNGTRFTSYVPCDQTNCQTCNPMSIPNGCVPGNTIRYCSPTQPAFATGWYVEYAFNSVGCTGYAHTTTGKF